MPGEPPRVQPSKKVAANWDDEGNPVYRSASMARTRPIPRYVSETLESLRGSFNRSLRVKGKADRTLVLYGHGSIDSVSGTTIEVSGPQGSASVAFSSSTKIMELTPAKPTDITAGQCVTIRPATDRGGTVTADRW